MCHRQGCGAGSPLEKITGSRSNHQEKPDLGQTVKKYSNRCVIDRVEDPIGVVTNLDPTFEKTEPDPTVKKLDTRHTVKKYSDRCVIDRVADPGGVDSDSDPTLGKYNGIQIQPSRKAGS